MPKPKRGWVGDAEVGERVGWAMREAAARVDREPWASVVLAQVGVEVGVAAVVHWLTERQEAPLRAWIEQVRLDTFKRPEEVALLNALLALSGRTIDGDRAVWSTYMAHVDRRNAFLHRGERPSSEEAQASLRACHDFQERLLGAAEKAMQRLDNLAVARTRTAALRDRTRRQVVADDEGDDDATEGT